MKLRILIVCGVFVAVLSAMSARVVSQCDEHKGQPGEEMMQAWMKYSEPGKYHAYLEPFVGRWEQSVKWWMAPGMPPQESTGVSEYKWVLGKRFLMQTVTSGSDEYAFEGMGLIGYDNFKRKYTGMWTDNMTTAIMTSLGTCDDSGKVFTMTGTHDDVFTGKPDQQFRSITRIVNNNTLVDEMFMNGPDGKEFKTVEITYIRKQ